MGMKWRAFNLNQTMSPRLPKTNITMYNSIPYNLDAYYRYIAEQRLLSNNSTKTLDLTKKPKELELLAEPKKRSFKVPKKRILKIGTSYGNITFETEILIVKALHHTLTTAMIGPLPEYLISLMQHDDLYNPLHFNNLEKEVKHNYDTQSKLGDENTLYNTEQVLQIKHATRRNTNKDTCVDKRGELYQESLLLLKKWKKYHTSTIPEYNFYDPEIKKWISNNCYDPMRMRWLWNNMKKTIEALGSSINCPITKGRHLPDLLTTFFASLNKNQ